MTEANENATAKNRLNDISHLRTLLKTLPTSLPTHREINSGASGSL